MVTILKIECYTVLAKKTGSLEVMNKLISLAFIISENIDFYIIIVFIWPLSVPSNKHLLTP